MVTPYVGFSNETLAKCPAVTVGDAIRCPQCGGEHCLEPPDNWDRAGTPLLMFYRCGGESFLGAIDGRLTVGVKADASGEVDLDP